MYVISSSEVFESSMRPSLRWFIFLCLSEREAPDGRTGPEEEGLEVGVLVTRSSGPNTEASKGN